ncbi:MAG: TIGR01777 family oxidoreductase [Acidobacteriota bacterium]
MKILVTGATGLIGRSLCRSLTEDGHTVVALSRSPRKPAELAVAEIHQWDSLAGPPPEAALTGVDAVVNLAGEPIVARRWSDEQKKLIRDSRVVTTRNLVDGLRSADRKPGVLVNGSAVGFYGNRGDEQLEETSPPGHGFMSDICVEWEREGARASELGIRVVQVRTGVVLSAEGGALQKMLPPFKLGVGGRLGSGKQWFPWIHIDDIVGIFRHAIYTSSLAGALNGVAPKPVTNSEFTRELAKVLHRPAFFPVPEIALRVLMGEMSEVLFVSQRLVPKAALASGYKFHYSALAEALEDVLGASKTAHARA